MDQSSPPIWIGEAVCKGEPHAVMGGFVTLFGDSFYQIQNYTAIEPFLMSIVSSSDHWLFIASTGGLSAGRVSPDTALFPYCTVDKLTENSENTGGKLLLLIHRAARTSLWEPFSERCRGLYAVERNLYKNICGTVLVFEECNLDLGLVCRCAWRTSEKFGFVKTTWLANVGDSACQVELLDGLQNLLPANVTMVTQNTFSSLLDAYKRSELEPRSGLAIFALSSTLTDLAEPSESLIATSAMQIGLQPDGYLLSSVQIEHFRGGQGVQTETEVRGRRGAYFVHALLDLAPATERSWHLLADVNQDSAALAAKIHWLQSDPSALLNEVEADIAAGQAGVWKLVASADGLQLGADRLIGAHHFANVLFNLMRGGVFADQYWITAADFIDFVSVHNRSLLQGYPDFFAALPARVYISDLQARSDASGSVSLLRLSYSCLPLVFSRRHGDPSRPWNRFAIHLKQPDGSARLEYQGNWRDIFQNWEALAISYPEFVESMVCTFLNATTAEGYNPYRITYHGVDWEIPEPGNPWANIGYWSDHQIIYLLKLMEISTRLHPGRLHDCLARAMFSYAEVPYRLHPYADLLKDPYNTIDYDWELAREIEARCHTLGTDGKLLLDSGGQVHHVSMAEKLLTLLLAKLVNFVPEGGIWMNTQRPEWNDANNALVGKGLSVVTLCYLRRYLVFCREFIAGSGLITLPINREVWHFYRQVSNVLAGFQGCLSGSFNDVQRRAILDLLGEAGSDYRMSFYRNSFSGELALVPLPEMVAFLELAQQYVEHSLRANRRSDGLYHAYNVLKLEEGSAIISPLNEMLEGQVAMLSSGMLTGAESLDLLYALRQSALYQADQHTYLLYPDRDLPGFLEKNCLTQDHVNQVTLFRLLFEAGDQSILTCDINGVYHFNGRFRNLHDLNYALQELKVQPEYAPWIDKESEKIRALFEDTFHHDQFTGRSGTFFAYEGLGSVYWHMVAKLLLAVQETALRAGPLEPGEALLECYADIRQGLSFNKSPGEYGAFPSDPYSHTPKGQGARQPGMTGLVKELILTRQVELGWSVKQGRLSFDLRLLDRGELLNSPAQFVYLDVHGQKQSLDLPAGSLAYTICQVPVLLKAGAEAGMILDFADGSSLTLPGLMLDEDNSRHIFKRDGHVRRLEVFFLPES